MEILEMQMYRRITKLVGANENENNRTEWLAKVLASIPKGLCLLDAGAGELRNRPLCEHLKYVSQDICEYEGSGDAKGLQTGKWDTTQIDIVSDITNIPAPDASFDVILCSEVFEHLPDPLKALDEFSRLLKPNGKLILTAPFASLVHFAPYHYATGFSRYWYEHHLPIRRFKIEQIVSNGDWFSFLKQEMFRLPRAAKNYGDWSWPFAYIFAGIGLVYFFIRGNRQTNSDELACFGWHCVATKSN